MKIKSFFKAVIFVFVLLIGFFCLQELLVGDDDLRDQKRISGFFQERESSLDAVFIGSSTTYAYWTAPTAWNSYGIAVYPLSNASQPLAATKFLIDDARKRQPDALYIVNVTSVLDEYDLRLHKLTDNYPFTLNKYPMINYVCDRLGLSFTQKMEYFFPILRFHERWSKLSAYDFNPDPEEYKGAGRYASFLKKSEDLTSGKSKVDSYAPLSDEMLRSINDIMDYCEQEKIKVLFVAVPQSLKNTERLGKINTMVKTVRDRGFDILDLRDYVDEIKLDYKTDFYNAEHANIHGAIKITDFLSRYLIENYGFADKRGKTEYADWDVAYEMYYDVIQKHLSEQELEFLRAK